MTKVHCGVTYVAFGDRYSLMSLRSAKSAEVFGHNVQIITNKDWLNSSILERLGLFNTVITYLDLDDAFNRKIKVNLIAYSLFEHTIYLDCDTVVHRSLDSLFSITSFYDFAVRSNSHPYRSSDYLFNLPFSPMDFTHFNGGVFVFKRNKHVIKLFRTWLDLYNSLGNSADQPALASALFEHRESISLLPLSGIYNFTPNYYISHSSTVSREIVVEHYTLDLWHIYCILYIQVILENLSVPVCSIAIYPKWRIILFLIRIFLYCKRSLLLM